MRILVATWPFLGHVLPTKRFVRAAVASGHRVTWLTHSGAREHVEDAGATYRARTSPAKVEGWGPAELRVWLDRSKHDEPGQRKDLTAALAAVRPDVLVVDPCMLGIPAQHQVPTVVLGMLPLLNPDPTFRAIFQCGIPEAEMPQLFPHVVFLGPLLPDDQPWTPPDWWHALDPQKPRIVVTQGTLATDPGDLIIPAVEALADLPVEVVVQSASWAARGAPDPPPNVHVLPWMSLPHVLHGAACFVTNGGWGGVQCALVAGVPMVLSGTTEDKREVGKRIGWVAGSGIALQARPPTAHDLREAVLTTLLVPRYAERARYLAARCRGTEAAGVAVRLLETLVPVWASAGSGTARPRSASPPTAAPPQAQAG